MKVEDKKMTTKEFCNLTAFDQDKTTGKQISHSEKYGRIIKAIGLEKIINILPFSKEAIKDAIKSDEHLNNLPLRNWDNAAEYLKPLFVKIGITSFSLSELVCTLKESARLSIK